MPWLLFLFDVLLLLCVALLELLGLLLVALLSLLPTGVVGVLLREVPVVLLLLLQELLVVLFLLVIKLVLLLLVFLINSGVAGVWSRRAIVMSDLAGVRIRRTVGVVSGAGWTVCVVVSGVWRTIGTVFGAAISGRLVASARFFGGTNIGAAE